MTTIINRINSELCVVELEDPEGGGGLHGSQNFDDFKIIFSKNSNKMKIIFIEREELAPKLGLLQGLFRNARKYKYQLLSNF